MGRALLILLVLLAGGSALATPQQYKEAVKGAVQGMTLDEIIQWSNREFRRQATVGRYVRWGGSIVLGSALVAAGLDYFYNYLRRETGTSLDRWYWMTGPPPIQWVGTNPDKLTHEREWLDHLRRSTGSNSCVYVPRVRGLPRQYSYQSDGVEIRFSNGTSEWFVESKYGFSSLEAAMDYGRQRAVSLWVGGLKGSTVCAPALQDKPPLSDWLRQYPDAANGVKQAVTTYLDNTQATSPSQPWPGVRLDPVPNPNQWTDNPFTRPDIDTDGDGYPDWVEWYEANRRGVPWPDVINDPTVYPDPKGDPDGDGFTTWEEISVGTNPYDPNSRPSRRPAPSIDTDGDGWPDAEEIKRGTDPTNPNDFPYNLPYDQDSDGDGVPDWKEIESGTDPYSPESRPEQRPEDQPKDEGWPGGPPVPGLKEVEFPTREAERRPLPELDRLLRLWEEQVVQRWQEAVGELREVLSRKFPFALTEALKRVTVIRGSAECTFTVPVGPVQATFSPCNTVVFQVMEAFRPVLAALLWITVLLTMVRRALDIQP